MFKFSVDDARCLSTLHSSLKVLPSHTTVHKDHINVVYLFHGYIRRASTLILGRRTFGTKKIMYYSTEGQSKEFGGGYTCNDKGVGGDW